MLRLAVIIGFCTLAIIPIAGFASNIIKNEVLLIAFTFGFGYVALPAMLLYVWPEPSVPSMESALAAGDLVTTQYSAVKLVQLEHIDERGPYFLVETLEFRVFANRPTGLVYGVEPSGTPLESWPVYGEFTESTDLLVDSEIYDKTIAQLVARLGGKEVRLARRGSDA